MYAGDDVAEAELTHFQNNLTRVEKNGQVLFSRQAEDAVAPESTVQTDRSILNIADIIEFARSVDLDMIRPVIQPQIDCNIKIAEEGVNGDYGQRFGQRLFRGCAKDDVLTKGKAYAVAGADARMSGCNMTVVTSSMSGNQGPDRVRASGGLL